MAGRRAATVRFTAYQWRLLEAMQRAGLPRGAEPLPVQRVLIAALLEAAKARGVEPAAVLADDHQLDLEPLRQVGR